MRLYEIVLVMKASLSEADRKKVLSGIKDLLKDLKVATEDEWGQKPLAYSIKKEVAGFYHRLNVEGEAAIPADFETKLLRNDNILRHLVIRVK
jgi:small subunit ribosomal protein S6